jgi:hypothetical protein
VLAALCISLKGSICNLVLNNMDYILSNIITPDNRVITFKTYRGTGKVSFQLVVTLRRAAYFGPQLTLCDIEDAGLPFNIMRVTSNSTEGAGPFDLPTLRAFPQSSPTGALRLPPALDVHQPLGGEAVS